MSEYVARTVDVVVEELDDGLVVFDRRNGQAHWLDADTTAVWRACEHKISSSGIARATGLPLARCQTALDQLVDVGLANSEAATGFSRRAALRGAAKVGMAGAAAGPILTAIIPTAAAAASTPGTGGGGGGGGCTDPCTPGTQLFPSDPATVEVGQANGGVVYGPTVPAGNGAYSTIPGTTWVGPGDFFSAAPGIYYYSLTTPIMVPCSAKSAKLSVQFYSDNYGAAFVNGNQVAQNLPCGSSGEEADYGSGGASPTSVTVDLAPGSSNSLQFQVENCGPGNNPTALDFLATLTITC